MDEITSRFDDQSLEPLKLLDSIIKNKNTEFANLIDLGYYNAMIDFRALKTELSVWPSQIQNFQSENNEPKSLRYTRKIESTILL